MEYQRTKSLKSPFGSWVFFEYIRTGLSIKKFTNPQGSNPAVFKYYYCLNKIDVHIYKLVFYGYYTIYLYSDPLSPFDFDDLTNLLSYTLKTHPELDLSKLDLSKSPLFSLFS